LLLWADTMVLPGFCAGQEVNRQGWPIPDLKGLLPYNITIRRVDGVEKIAEKFFTPDQGHVARLSGNGRIYGYAVDKDREPPIDYLLVDVEGFGVFTHRFGSEDSYTIPLWVSK
jgi:hypothetical protein